MPIDAFLKLKNANDQPVEGECTDAGFENAIEIRSFTLGEAGDRGSPPAGEAAADGGGAAGREQMRADTRSLLAAEFAKAAAANRARQEQRDRLRKQVGSSFRSSGMHAKALVIDQLAEKAKQKSEQTEDDPRSAGRLKFTVTKDVDASSADLFQAYCVRKSSTKPADAAWQMTEFATAEVTLRKMFGGSPKPYLVCTFSDVNIDTYTLGYDADRNHLTETVVFTFGRYTMMYQVQDATGQAAPVNPIKSGSLAV